jgi:hypothetical protein
MVVSQSEMICFGHASFCTAVAFCTNSFSWFAKYHYDRISCVKCDLATKLLIDNAISYSRRTPRFGNRAANPSAGMM